MAEGYIPPPQPAAVYPPSSPSYPPPGYPVQQGYPFHQPGYPLQPGFPSAQNQPAVYPYPAQGYPDNFVQHQGNVNLRCTLDCF